MKEIRTAQDFDDVRAIRNLELSSKSEKVEVFQHEIIYVMDQDKLDHVLQWLQEHATCKTDMSYGGIRGKLKRAAKHRVYDERNNGVENLFSEVTIKFYDNGKDGAERRYYLELLCEEELREKLESAIDLQRGAARGLKQKITVVYDPSKESQAYPNMSFEQFFEILRSLNFNYREGTFQKLDSAEEMLEYILRFSNFERMTLPSPLTLVTPKHLEGIDGRFSHLIVQIFARGISERNKTPKSADPLLSLEISVMNTFTRMGWWGSAKPFANASEEEVARNLLHLMMGNRSI